MTAPKRIQRKRTAGWRMPENAVYVGRPTKWGNPWSVEEYANRSDLFYQGAFVGQSTDPAWARQQAVERYELHTGPMGNHELDVDEVRAALGGKDLACWCPIDQPCHADVLLELANGGAR